MRKLITLIILALAFSSCSNVGKFKESIESLSSEWETTTAKVSATVDQITQAQEQAKSVLDAMAVPEGASLTEEQTNQVASLKQTVQDQMGNLGQLAQKAFEFVEQWQNEGEKLDALKSGLAEGKLPGDVQATIDSLKGLVGTAGEKVSEWEGQVNSANEAVQSAADSYNEIIATVQGPAEM
ncbi:MAG: hypothetical protein J5I94_30375 [Phaeodactylibacter sp.]|nr:hypothetical protein [Phaeodactylibacter sp.]